MIRIDSKVEVTFNKQTMTGVVTHVRGVEVTVKFAGAELAKAERMRHESFDPPDCLVVNETFCREIA